MSSLGRQWHRLWQRVWLGLVSFRQRIDKHLFGSWRANRPARRFAVAWIVVMVLVSAVSILQVRSLRQYYLRAAGEPGGVYTEGIVGTITTINPVLAEAGANADATRLVFSGLTQYDGEHKLVGDLAERWHIDPNGRDYTFSLRPNLKWQDGQPLTAGDVAFTVNLIQNPDARSPLASAWQGVVTTVVDARTVRFTLPVRYDNFLASTTVGIVPEHSLAKTSPTGLRVASFNQQPVGSGPFSVTDFDTGGGIVRLQANRYYVHGKPMLDTIILHVYDDFDSLQSAYRKHQVNAMSRVPVSAGQDFGIASTVHALEVPEQVGLFMRNKSPLLGEVAVRQAISLLMDRPALVRNLLHGNATPLTTPLMPGQVPATSNYPAGPANLAAATKLLDDAGWKLGANGKRARSGQVLDLQLVTGQSPDFAVVARQIVSSLSAVGIHVKVTTADAATLQNSYIRPRNYDLLLYGINLGAELDPYAYWESSKVSDPGLNIAQYSSPVADKALQGEHTTNDEAVRTVRLTSFLEAWEADAPAAMLYVPNYIYITQAGVQGVSARRIVSPADRWYGVQNWTIKTHLVPKL